MFNINLNSVRYCKFESFEQGRMYLLGRGWTECKQGGFIKERPGKPTLFALISEEEEVYTEADFDARLQAQY